LELADPLQGVLGEYAGDRQLCAAGIEQALQFGHTTATVAGT
jgi:hypothetical protein